MTVSTMDYGRSIHSIRNIIGRITYGLIGLDKLLQNDTNESDDYLHSFFSLFESPNLSSRGVHKLLPEVEGTIVTYNPQLREELVRVAERVREIRNETNASKTEIGTVYDQLETLLNKVYETTSNRSNPSSFD